MKKLLMFLLPLAFFLMPWAARTLAQTDTCTVTVTAAQPYTEGFESCTGSTYSTSSQLPDCWTGWTNGTSSTASGYLPHVVTGSGSYCYIKTGSKALSMLAGSTTYGNTKYVKLPAFSQSLNSFFLSFWMSTSSSTTGKLAIGYITAGDSEFSTFTAIDSVLSSSATYHSGNGLQASAGYTYETLLTAIPDSATNLVLRWTATSTAMTACCVDDIMISFPPTCPHVTNLAVTPLADSAFLSWTEAGSATSWEVAVYLNDTLENTLMVSDTSVWLTGLTPNSDYSASVRAVCGAADTSTALSVLFHTLCVAVSDSELPYTYGFEDATGSGAAYDFNSCFNRYYVGSTTNYPSPTSGQVHTGNYAAYFAATTNYYSYLTFPLFESSISQLQLTFWAYKTSSNYGKIMVGVMTDPDDPSTFDTIASLQVSETSTWEYFEVPLSTYAGTGRYLTLRAVGGATNYTYVDDITVDLPPACPRPTDLVVSNITTTSADISWTDNTSGTAVYEVDYSDGQTTEHTTVYTNSATLTDLSHSTTYDVTVYANCGTDSSTTNTVSFSTLCGLITADDLPVTYDFEGLQSGTSSPMPNCWNRYNDATGTANYYPYINSSTTYAHSGTNYLYFYTNTTSSYADHIAAVLPPIDTTALSMGQLEMLLWACSGTSSTAQSKVMVGVMTDPDSIETFVPVDTLEFTTTLTEYSVSFSGYSGTGSYPAIRMDRQTTYNYAYIDDITLRVASTCPTAENVRVTSVLPDSVYLAWDSDTSQSVTSWDVYIGTPGFAFDTATYFSVSDTTIAIGDLAQGTEYQVYVIAYCSGTAANLSSPVNFFTTCEIPTDSLPYVEDFESYGSGSANSISSCWTKGTNHASIAYPYPYLTNAITGSRSLYMYGYRPSSTSTAQVYSYAALPSFETALTNLQLNFNMRRYGTTSNYYTSLVVVGVMSNPSDISTFTPVDTIDMHDAAALEVQSYEIYFDQYTGNGRYIAFLAPVPPLYGTGTYAYNYTWIDDVEVKVASTCRRVETMSVDSVSSDMAILSWVSSCDDASQYVVAYSTDADFDPDTCSTLVTTTDTTVTLTGLQEFTDYYWSVRTYCSGDSASWSTVMSFHTAMDCGDNYTNIYETIGTGSTSSYLYMAYCSSSSTYAEGYSTMIYTAEEMMNLGLLGSGDIHDLFVHSANYSGTVNNFEVYMMETSQSEFGGATDTIPLSDMTLVYSDSAFAVSPLSWNRITLDSVFHYSGTQNLAITFRRTSSPSSSLYFYATNISPNYRSIYGYLSATSSTGIPTATRSYTRLDVTFNICSEIPTCLRPTDLTALYVASDSAVISWTGSTGNYEYFLTTTDSVPDSTTVGVAVTAPQVSLSGLTSDTWYNIYARRICSSGTSEWSTGLQFHTPCAPQALPFTEDFESYASGSSTQLNSCWYKGTNSTTAYPYPYSSNAVSGSRSLYFYAYQPNSASSTPYYSYAALPEMDADIDTLALSFNVRRYTNSSNYYTTRLVIGVMTDPADITTFTPVDTVDLHDEEAGSIHGVEVFFDGYTGSGRYIAIYDEVPPLYGTSTYSYSYAYVDDILVDYMPSCFRPENITATVVTDSSVTLNWTDRGTVNGGYLLEYGLSGFPQGTGTQMTASTKPVTISGLQAGTTYDVYIRSICSTGDTGDWSFAYGFKTNCRPESLPYTEDFDSYTSGSSSSIDVCWYKGTNSTTAYPYPYSSLAINGANSLYFYAYHPSSATSTAYYSYAAMPEMEVPLDSLILSFNMKRYSTVTDYYTTRIVVGVMTDPEDITTFIPVDTIDMKDVSANTVQGFDVIFDNVNIADSLTAHIAFYNEVPPLYGTATYSYSYVRLDDVLVDYRPSCMRPTGMQVSTSSTGGVSLDWTDVGTPLGYEIEYGPAGFIQGNGTTLSVLSHPYTFQNLSPATSYSCYIRAICDAGDTSAWTSVFNFESGCGAISLPYSHDFENDATGTSADFVNCWERVSDGSPTYYPYVSSGTTYAHSGTHYLYFYLATSASYPDNEVCVLPELDVANYPMNGVTVSFWGQASTSAVEPVSIAVGVMTNPGLITTFEAVDTVIFFSEQTYYEVPLTSYSGIGTYVAIKAINPRNGTAAYAYIDDVSLVGTSPCATIENLASAGCDTSTISITWDDEVATQWQVEYGPHGFIEGTGITQTVTQQSFTATGLDVNTPYDLYVSAYCPVTGLSFSRMITLYTSQMPGTLPYFYDFEDANEWNNWQTSSNHTNNWYRGSAVADGGAYSMYMSANNGTTYRPYSYNAVVNAIAYRDIDFGSVDTTISMTFKARVGGTIGHGYDGLFILIEDPALPVVSSSNNITTPYGHINDIYVTQRIRCDTSWGNYEVNFDNVSGVKRVVFYWMNQSTSSYTHYDEPAAVDSIYIDYETCVRPYNLSAYANESMAILSWDGPSAAQYDIVYRPYTEGASSNVLLTSNTNNITISGLEANTQYIFWVGMRCSDVSSSLMSDGYVFLTQTCAGEQDFPLTNSLPYEGVSKNIMAHPNYSNSFCEVIIDSSELGGPRYINSMKIYSNADNPAKTNVYIYLKPTTKSVFSAATAVENVDSTAVLVYHGDFTTHSGINAFMFDTTYSYDGASNLMLILVDSSNYGDNYNGLYGYHYQVCNGRKTLSSYSNTIYYDPTNLTGASSTKYTYSFRPKIELVSCGLNYCAMPMLLEPTDVAYASATINWLGSGENYEVAVKAAHAGTWPDAESVTVTLGQAGAYTFTGLEPNTIYQYRVRQICDSVLTSEWTPGNFITDSLPCYAPEDPSVTGVTYSTVSLDWEAGEESAWRIHVWNSGKDTSVVVSSHPATMGGLNMNTDYYVAVRAVCGGGIAESEYSDTLSFTTVNCATVTGVAVSDVTSNSAVVTWDASAESYDIEYGPYLFQEGTGTRVDNISGNSYTLTGLQDEYHYSVTVRAHCDDVVSNWTESTDFTTEPVGIATIDGAQVSLYPNPATATTTVTLKGVSGEVTLTIVDLNGRTVMTETMSCEGGCTKTLELDNLLQGAYFVRLSGESVNAVKKLVVK